MTMAKTTPLTTRERLHALVHELNFKGMQRVLDAELDRAERDAAPAAEVVQRLLAEQASFQRERAMVNRVARARLPWQWTIDTFPFARQSGVNKAQILALAGLDFVRRAQNLVLIGATGTGKTGIALAMLRQACVNGWRGALLQRPDAVRRAVRLAGRSFHDQAAHGAQPHLSLW